MKSGTIYNNSTALLVCRYHENPVKSASIQSLPLLLHLPYEPVRNLMFLLRVSLVLILSVSCPNSGRALDIVSDVDPFMYSLGQGLVPKLYYLAVLNVPNRISCHPILSS